MYATRFIADTYQANEIQSCVAAGCSILACSSILLTSAWVYSVPSASNMLDRVSFRLLLHALCFEIIYDISYIVVVAVSVVLRLQLTLSAWRQWSSSKRSVRDRGLFHDGRHRSVSAVRVQHC